MNLEEPEHQVYYLMETHKVPKTLNQVSREKQTLQELCDLSSAREARIVSKEEAIEITRKSSPKHFQQLQK